MESSGIHEFTGPKIKEREHHNAEIWKQFAKTIERREDSYFVRLPWKNNSSTHPYNKCMAFRRLQATITTLTKNPPWLEKYNETIIQQLNEDIIEEVDESIHQQGVIIHYLSHRAVVTPYKETTKLRIVYDTSAHL